MPITLQVGWWECSDDERREVAQLPDKSWIAVDKEGAIQRIDENGSRKDNFLDYCLMKFLPDCTGWDWIPPEDRPVLHKVLLAVLQAQNITDETIWTLLHNDTTRRNEQRERVAVDFLYRVGYGRLLNIIDDLLACPRGSGIGDRQWADINDKLTKLQDLSKILPRLPKQTKTIATHERVPQDMTGY